jgi:predicted DsbA family dithiol-disulfide isomerase
LPSILRHIALAHTYYYTDPACPWSWALEPSLRKLRHELGEGLGITYVMCGMAREFGDPIPLVADMLEAADRSGMPVDPRLWLTVAPRSSYPACIAVKAAAEQGDPGRYLRRLREGLQCRRRKLDTTDALLETARSVPGLDLDKLRLALGSHAVLEAFGADLDRAGAVPAEHHSPGTGRVRLPSLEFMGDDGAVHGVYGFCDYGALRAGAVAAGAQPAGAGGGSGSSRGGSGLHGPPSGSDTPAPPSVEDALRRFGSMATAEVASVCDLPGPRAPAELWRLALEWRVRPERLGSGELWSLV